jgi:hypothetical protein
MQNQPKITIYLLIGLTFAIINIFLNFGSLLSITDGYTKTSLENNTTADKLTLFTLDVILWPLVLFRNLLLYFPIVILTFVVFIFIFSFFDNFKSFKKVLRVIFS